MPQRKRTTAPSQLPPLTFVNSPVFQPAPVLTPDIAVDHPVTARTVAIEEITDTTWVSPQFRNLHGDQRRCQTSRRTGKTRRGTSTQLRHQPRGTLTEIELQCRQSRFRPLHFVHDLKRADVEDGINFPPRTKTRLRSHSEGNDDFSLTHDKGNHVNSFIMKNLDFSSGVRTVSTDHMTIAQAQHSTDSRSKENQKCFTATNSSGDSCCVCDSRDAAQSPFRETSCGRKCNSRGHLKPCNLFCQSHSSSTDITVSKMKKFTALTDRYDTQSMNNQDGQDGKLSHLHDPEADDCSEAGSQVMSQQFRARDLNKSWQSSHSTMKTPPKLPGINTVVLATDTPEYDYGLTFRQRQQKYGLRGVKQ